MTLLSFPLRRLPKPLPNPPVHGLSVQTSGVCGAALMDAVAHDIGRDHARHNLVPPAEHLHPSHPVRQGWESGREALNQAGQRPLPATAAAQHWLRLRLRAWMEGLSFESVQLTPQYLRQIVRPQPGGELPGLCPVLRQPMTELEGAAHQATVVRMHEQAGYAAGNLALVSRTVAQAKLGLDWQAALAHAEQAAASADGLSRGLDAAAWRRLSALLSYVHPLPHSVAVTLPLGVLPPNRLRLLNPVQGLQALLTMHLMLPGWSSRIRPWAAGLDNGSRRELAVLLLSLWRHSRAAQIEPGAEPSDAIPVLRQGLEDAWQQAGVMRSWQRLVGRFSVNEIEALLERASTMGLAGRQCLVQPLAQATEGWALETGGRLTDLDGASAEYEPKTPSTTGEMDHPTTGWSRARAAAARRWLALSHQA